MFKKKQLRRVQSRGRIPRATPRGGGGGMQRSSSTDTPVRPCKFEELGGEYELYRELGRGSYGVVYKARKLTEPLGNDMKPNFYAIKRIFATGKATNIKQEILFLEALAGKPNIVPLVGGMMMKSLGQVTLIFPYYRSKYFQDCVTTFTIHDIRDYMYNLLVGIKSCTEMGIVHRDIKPTNFLYDPADKKGYIIDFGLSEIEVNEKNRPVYEDIRAQQVKESKERSQRSGEEEKMGDIGHSHTNLEDEKRKTGYINELFTLQRLHGGSQAHRIGTKGYLAPEVIFKAKYQTSAVDIWGAGVMMMSLLSGKHPLCAPHNKIPLHKTDTSYSLHGLIPLINIFGIKKMQEIAYHFGIGISINNEADEDIGFPLEPIGWRMLFRRREDIEESSIDLVSQMMELDPLKRISAGKALQHPFFDPIKEGHGGNQTTGTNSQSQGHHAHNITNNNPGHHHGMKSTIGNINNLNTLNSTQGQVLGHTGHIGHIGHTGHMPPPPTYGGHNAHNAYGHGNSSGNYKQHY